MDEIAYSDSYSGTRTNFSLIEMTCGEEKETASTFVIRVKASRCPRWTSAK
jgi:hypothetical protein